MGFLPPLRLTKSRASVAAGNRKKSPDAFRTIGEAAAEIGVQPHVLRFWETKFPSVKPLVRAGGRRYYRPRDIERLQSIKRLLHDEGYTIKGAQKLLRTGGDSAPAEETASAPAIAPVNALPEVKALRALQHSLRDLAAEAREVAAGRRPPLN